MNANLIATGTPTWPDDLEIDLRRELIPGEKLLGSQLGQRIHRAARARGIEVDMRSLGGLSAFVHTHLSGTLHRIERQDPSVGDEEFIVVEDPSAANTSQSWRAVTGDDASFWDGYNNPSRSTQFALSNDKKLHVAARGVEVPQGWTSVKKMATADYVTIARKFAISADAKEKPNLEAVIDGASVDSFISRWLSALRASLDPLAVRKWEIFRIDEVIQALAKQLSGLGVPENKVREVGMVLKSSQEKRHSPRLLKRSEPIRPQPSLGSIEEDIRAVVALAATTLSIEELRKISLPIGFVADVFNKQREKKRT